MIVTVMSPKKSVTSLYDKSLKLVTEYISKYVQRQVQKVNFISDFSQASDDFIMRCDSEKKFIDENFVSTLRYKVCSICSILE